MSLILVRCVYLLNRIESLGLEVEALPHLGEASTS